MELLEHSLIFKLQELSGETDLCEVPHTALLLSLATEVFISLSNI